MAMMQTQQQGLLSNVRSRSVQTRSVVLRSPLLIRAQAISTPLPTSISTSSNGNGVGSLTPAPQLLTVNVPEIVPGVLSPAANYENLVKAGAKKTQLSASNLIVSGFLAGCYIAFGAFLTMSVQTGLQSLVPTLPGLVKLIGGLIFPVGLTLVTLSGCELYTGNTAVVPMAVYEGKASVGGLLHNWFWSYLGNFIGSLAMVAAVAVAGNLVGSPVPVGVAEYKASLPLLTTVVRATLCNWLVCMAVWNAASATTLTGKMAGLWGPIACFVAIGLEHSVANMFFIPMGIVMGAKVTFSEFLLNNLLPVTLGNTLGGFLFVGTAFAFIHGSLGKKKQQPATA